MVSKAKKRMAEPSTHAGLAIIAQSLTTAYPQYAPLLHGASLLFAGLATVMAERSTASK